MNERFPVLADRKSLADLAFDAIFQSIVAGEIRLGERLNEVQIAAQMGVSRGPVREAIQRLRQNGLIVQTTGKQSSVIHLSAEEVRQLFSVRVVLELAAIDEISPAEYAPLAAELGEILELIGKHVKAGRVPQMLDEEIRFHEVIVRASKNELLVELYSMLLARLRMILAVSIDKPGVDILTDVAECHIEIVAAFQKGDLEDAKSILKEHIWRSFPEVQQLPIFSAQSTS
jgi:DNA-binding GntR family transcriptional regulator